MAFLLITAMAKSQNAISVKIFKSELMQHIETEFFTTVINEG